jgi:hypothetical protein
VFVQELRCLLRAGRYALTGQRHWGHAFDLELRRRKTALFYFLLRSPLFDRSDRPTDLTYPLAGCL